MAAARSAAISDANAISDEEAALAKEDNGYSRGQGEMPILGRGDVPPAIQQDGFDFMNACIRRYWAGITNEFDSANACVFEAARWGYGSGGMDDFHDALHHLYTRRRFRGGDEWWWNSSSVVVSDSGMRAPKPFVEFAAAMKKHTSKLNDHAKEIVSLKKQAAQQGRASEWEDLGETMEDIESEAEDAIEYLWLLPDEKEIEFAKNGLGKIASYAGALGKVHKAATLVVDFTSRDEAVRFQAQATVFKEALQFVPVLGSYYAAAVDAGLKVIKFVNQKFDQESDRAWRASIGRDPGHKGDVYYSE